MMTKYQNKLRQKLICMYYDELDTCKNNHIRFNNFCEEHKSLNRNHKQYYETKRQYLINKLSNIIIEFDAETRENRLGLVVKIYNILYDFGDISLGENFVNVYFSKLLDLERQFKEYNLYEEYKKHGIMEKLFQLYAYKIRDIKRKEQLKKKTVEYKTRRKEYKKQLKRWERGRTICKTWKYGGYCTNGLKCSEAHPKLEICTCLNWRCRKTHLNYKMSIIKEDIELCNSYDTKYNILLNKSYNNKCCSYYIYFGRCYSSKHVEYIKSSKDIRCKFGPNCKYLKDIHNCKFFHSLIEICKIKIPYLENKFREDNKKAKQESLEFKKLFYNKDIIGIIDEYVGDDNVTLRLN